MRLIAIVDEPVGELGLIIAGMNHCNIVADRTGTGIAHDLIEHQNGPAKIGCPFDEIEAMGGLWHARGRHGSFWCSTSYTPAQSVAWELARLTEDLYETPLPRGLNTRPHLFDDDFHEVIDLARKEIDACHYDCQVEDTDAYFDVCLHLLRTGFRKAERRFGTGFESHDLYQAIRDAVAPHARNIEYEGQKFILNYGNGKATCRPN